MSAHAGSSDIGPSVGSSSAACLVRADGSLPGYATLWGALEQGRRIHKEWLRPPFQRCAVLLLHILWVEFR